MLASSEPAAPCLLPIMRYRDLAAAIDWLSKAFGFEKQVAVNDVEGTTFYAQVSCGSSLIMLGAVRETDLDKLMTQPDEVGGVETQSCYVVVDDIDEHYARAKAAGAEIVLEIRSDGLGRRGYSCRDPQGHIWNFGTYNPWKGKLLEAPAAPAARRLTALKFGIGLAALAAAAVAGAVLWLANGPATRDVAAPTASVTGALALEEARSALARERALRETAQNAAEAARRELSLERVAKEAAERTAEALRQEIARARTASEPSHRLVDALRQDVARERAAKEAAERAAEGARQELAKERSLREGAQATPTVSPEDLARERSAKEAAEMRARRLESELAQARSGREAALKSAEATRAELDKERAAREALERDLKAAHERAAAAERQQSALIETSATGTGASDRVSSRTETGGMFYTRRPRKRLMPLAGSPRYPPTYLTGLSEVPWPYNIWYRKEP
jgi:uncharacterized glyoxalase superfamily protein PhnB